MSNETKTIPISQGVADLMKLYRIYKTYIGPSQSPQFEHFMTWLVQGELCGSLSIPNPGADKNE